jgi:hypothetical protein
MCRMAVLLAGGHGSSGGNHAVTWTIAIAAVVQAVAAAIIVVFTIGSLQKSERMTKAAASQVEATQEQMRQSVLPILIADVIDWSSGNLGNGDLGFHICARNIGLGPALNVRIVFHLFRETNVMYAHRTWQGSVIGVNDQINMVDVDANSGLLELSVINSGQPFEDIGMVSIVYEDVYGRPGVIEDRIQYELKVLPGNSRVRMFHEKAKLPGF